MADGGALPREPDAALHVVVHPHPFKTARHEITYGAPPSLAEIVIDAEIPERYARWVRVWIDDWEIPRENWMRVRPKPGHLVRVLVVPQGGRGGGGKKNPLATILTLAVAVATIFLAPVVGGLALGAMGIASTAAVLGTTAGTLATAVAGMAINMVGNLLIAAFIKPPEQGAQPTDVGSVDGAVASPSFQLTGTQNRPNPWGSIPRIFGKRRVYPLVAARPFTETQGNDQYMRLLLLVGYGPLHISDIRIGDTPLSSFQGVAVETREGWPGDAAITLYTQIVSEDVLSISLLPDSTYIWRTTRTDTSQVLVDLTFPRGIALYNNQGNPTPFMVRFSLAWRVPGGAHNIATIINPADSGVVIDGGTFTITRATRDMVRVGLRFNLPSPGQYEVGLGNWGAALTALQIGEAYWTTMRSVEWSSPITGMPGLSLIAISIKASQQLNGVPDQISCIAQSYLPHWSGSTWTWGVSRNPAWAYAHMLRTRGTETMLTDDRLDLPAILDWANACASNAPDRAEPYWLFDGVVEGGSVFSALRTISAYGRAGFTMKDGKYSVVRDIPRTVPVQHITPRNSWGYTGRKAFLDMPHGLRIRFVNEALNYAEDERIVYADGYDISNATKFETLDMPGVLRSTQVWREGRYHIAQAQLRPETHSISMDIEALRATMGDYVMFAHDVMSIGLAQGRLLPPILNSAGTHIVAVVLDGEITINADRLYAIRVRNTDDGVSAIYAIVPEYATTDVLQLVTPVPVSSSAPEQGDLYLFGESNLEAAPMIITRIEPGPDMTATLTLVDAQPGVWTADSAAIPPFQTYITHALPPIRRQPPEVGFALRSDETALIVAADGTLLDRIAVDIAPPPVTDVAIGGFEVQWTYAYMNDWRSLERIPFDVRTVYILGVVQGQSYDVRLRAMSYAGILGPWRTAYGYTVVGKVNPPPEAARVLIQGKQIIVDYPNPPIDFWGWQVEFKRGMNSVRDGAISAHPGQEVVAMPFDISGLPSGPLSIWVTAVDTSGNKSDSSPMYINLRGAFLANQIDVVDYKALGWPGTITNGTINGGGRLVSASDPDDLFLPSLPELFGVPEDALFAPAVYLALSWEFTYLPATIDVPSQMTIDHKITPSGYTLDYSADDSVIFAAIDTEDFAEPDSSEFAPSEPTFGPFPASIVTKRIPYHFRVATPVNANERGVIHKFILILDVPDQEETIEDLVVPATGIRLPLVATYRQIRHIAYILQSDGNDADSIRKIDYDVARGPLVQAFKNGVAVPALADFRVKGIP